MGLFGMIGKQKHPEIGEIFSRCLRVENWIGFYPPGMKLERENGPVDLDDSPMESWQAKQKGVDNQSSSD